jgi:hypothetical protein
VERTHVSIRQLVDRIDRGELKLPEIQRSYVWKPTQVANLVDSLYRGYPSGSMLLWRPSEEVQERLARIERTGTGPIALAQYLLDGQQRLTSLHRVFHRHPRANVVFNVDTQRFQIQSAATAKDPRWVSVVDVVTAEKLSVIRRAVCESQPDLDEDMVEERLGRLRTLGDYEYYLEILTDLPYRAVADIFVRVNSKGRALKTVDLTLAVLSAEWPGVVGKIDEQAKHWAERGWPKIDAGFLVRALAATATDAATLGRLPLTPADELTAGWNRVIHGIEFLVHLLGENASIKTSNLIPSMNALVPLVVLLGRYDKNQEFTEADALIYWLLSVFVTGRYSAAADTKIAQDALAARSDDPVRAVYTSAGLMQAPLRISPQQLIGKGAGSPLFLLSYLVAKKKNAKDWWHDVEISESTGTGGFSIEYHHIHPQATLRGDYSKSEINDLANLAFISATANKKISDRSPDAYIPELLNDRDELTPHFVPLDEALRTAPAYRQFLVKRRELLAAAMTDLLDARRPGWVAMGPEAAADQPVVRSSLTVAGQPADLWFEATTEAGTWVATTPLADFERLLHDVQDGLGSSLDIGPELVQINQGQEDIVVPIGPVQLTGQLEDWLRVIDREKQDHRPDYEPPSDGAIAEGVAGEAVTLPVLETD